MEGESGRRKWRGEWRKEEGKVKGKVGEKLEEKVADQGGRAKKMVPNLTCYELAIRIMMERVEIMRENKTTKDRIGKVPTQLTPCLFNMPQFSEAPAAFMRG